MAKKLIGIQENMSYNHLARCRQDMRPTAQVDETRSPRNGKPFRSRHQKAVASATAVLNKTGKWKGTYTSSAPRMYHGGA